MLPNNRAQVGNTLEYRTSINKMHKATVLEVLPSGYRVLRDDGVTQTIRNDYETFAPAENEGGRF